MKLWQILSVSSLVLTLIIPMVSLSQDGGLDNIQSSDLNEIESPSPNAPRKEKSTTTHEETSFRLRDDEKGVPLGSYNTRQDLNRYSLLYHFHSDLPNLASISSFEFIYGRNFGAWWGELSLSKSTVRFSEVTTNNVQAVGANRQEIEDGDAELLSFGAGIGFRTTTIQKVIPSSRWFETVSAYLVYHQFEESTTLETFSGFGVRADFGIHYRTSESFHWGVRTSYHLAPVNREQRFETEKTSDRSLTLSWLDFALDFTFYY